MHSCVTSKNVNWCHLFWPTLYRIVDEPVGLFVIRLNWSWIWVEWSRLTEAGTKRSHSATDKTDLMDAAMV